MAMIIWSIVIFSLSEISITAGYHRLYSHRSFKTNPIVEFLLLFCASLASQRSALRWSFEHRLHHAFVDTDRDPYSIKRGFWFAHFSWMFEDPKEIDKKMVPDLLKNKLVMFQDKHENKCMYMPNLAITALLGYFLNDFIGAVVIALGLRLFFNHHCTFFINSLAHTVGSKPFSKKISAVNNYLISFPTFGEGFHNFHHAFPRDYRNGIRWWDFDPTKWLIRGLNYFGLATELKSTSNKVMEKRLLSEMDHTKIHHAETPEKSYQEEASYEEPSKEEQVTT